MYSLIRALPGAFVFGLLVSCNSSTPLSSNVLPRATTPPEVKPLVFEPPVKVLPANGYGYEPTVVVDGHGNIWSTAHPENYQIPLAPDEDSPTLTRSMSWARISYDGGKTWTEPPGLTALAVQNHQVGVEGDMVLDDAGHLYFVDTYVTDNTLTRWTVNGPGDVTFDFSNPVIPALQLVDDRPWITAHGDGHVFYFGNMGTRDYPLGTGSGSGNGPGRYTVYASYDGGRNFDPLGYTLKDSGWCRPAADHAPGSPYVYAFCSNDGDTLYSFVSADDGRTYERYAAGEYNNGDSNTRNPSNPQLQVAPDGSAVYALFLDGSEEAAGETRIRLFTSKDHGQTWKEQDITPFPARYIYAWLAVSADGKQLGMAIYGKPQGQPWFVYAGAWKPGAKPVMTSLDPDRPVGAAGDSSAGGDYLGSYFDPEGRLNVVWQNDASFPLSRDIFFSRSTTAPKSASGESAAAIKPPVSDCAVSDKPASGLVNPGLNCHRLPPELRPLK